MSEKIQLMFSLITGEMYTLLVEELETVDNYQLPLKRKPKSSCNKCYGRFYTGKNMTHNLYIMCPSCAVKCLDVAKLKSLQVPSNQEAEINENEFTQLLS